MISVRKKHALSFNWNVAIFYLSIFSPVFDVIRDNRNIFYVQRCVNLVHYIQRRRFIMMKRKNEGQTRQGFFPSGKVHDIFPTLFWGSNRKADAIVEGSQWIDQLKVL